jgi:hypothetical protein
MPSVLALVNNVKNWVSAIAVSAGIADASKVPLTNSSGILDNSLINWASPGAIGSTTASTVRCSQFTVAGSSGITKDIRWFTGTIPLWNLFSNSSDNLVLSYYDAAGAYLGDALSVNKATGVITFPKTNIFTPAQTFSAGLNSSGTIAVTGSQSQITLTPSSPSPGGGFRYVYTSGSSIGLVFAGNGCNLQFGLGTSLAAIFNSGSPLTFQADASGTAQGMMFVGTGSAFSSSDRLQVNGNIASNGSVRVGSYTVATVPANNANTIGAMIYVSNESGGATIAFSDGTNWRRVHDRAIIS